MDCAENIMDKTIFEKLNSFVPSLPWNSTINIVTAINGDLYQWGTGTLLKIANNSFIITAAHVVSKIYQHKMQLYTSSNGSFVHLYGDWVYRTESDLFDIAILRLHPNISSQIGTKSYIGLYNIDFTDDHIKGIFYLCGYPEILSKPSTPTDPMMVSRLFQFMTHMYTGATDCITDYNAEYHFLLDSTSGKRNVDGEPVEFIGRAGKVLDLPGDLGGISGCSVWQIGTSEIPLEQWNNKRAKIVGIQTSVFRETKVIKVTRWSAVSSLLYEAYPDLRPAMSLWYSE